MGAWQLIEIMRALIDEKVHVLAFDEPTSSLSDEEAENLFRMIETLKKGASRSSMFRTGCLKFSGYATKFRYSASSSEREEVGSSKART